MYSREEASAIRHQFWTSLGLYLAPVPSANGNKVNWINYKTGIRSIQFKMDAAARSAIVYIQVTGKDREQRLACFNLFRNFKNDLPGEWEWVADHQDEHGHTTSRIYTELRPANIFQQEQWPAIISFFKEKMIALDLFWTGHREIFEMAV